MEGAISSHNDANSSVNTWPAGVTTRDWQSDESCQRRATNCVDGVAHRPAAQCTFGGMHGLVCASQQPACVRDYLEIYETLQNRHGFDFQRYWQATSHLTSKQKKIIICRKANTILEDVFSRPTETHSFSQTQDGSEQMKRKSNFEETQIFL